MTPEELARVMSRVEIVDDHWIWTGYTTPSGYGQTYVDGKVQRVHRVMLEHYLGRNLSIGMVARHRPLVCNCRNCCNPDHLQEGTVQDNINDQAIDGTRRVGSNKPLAKLTESDIPVIRADTRSHQQIADEYNVSRGLISNIKRRITWTHVV